VEGAPAPSALVATLTITALEQGRVSSPRLDSTGSTCFPPPRTWDSSRGSAAALASPPARAGAAAFRTLATSRV